MNKKVLHTLLFQDISCRGDKIAIEEDNDSISYNNLNNYVERITRCMLDQIKMQKGEVVAVYLRSGINYVSSILAINKGGGVFLPIERSYPPKRIEAILSKVRPRIFITDKEHKEELRLLLSSFQNEVGSDNIITVNNCSSAIMTEHFEKGSYQNPVEDWYLSGSDEVGVEGEDSNYLIYTSGSTGEPKIIEGQHKSLSHFVHWQVKEFDITSSARVSQLAPLSFDASLRDIFVPLLSGGTLCIPNEQVRKNPSALLGWIKNRKVNIVHMVPSIFRLLAAELHDGERLEDLQLVFLAGEALYSKDVQLWQDKLQGKTEFINFYGPSETTLIKTFYRIRDLTEDPTPIISLGRPIANASILIVDQGVAVEVGEIGEILIKTPFKSKGYYKDDQLTSLRFIQNPLHQKFEDIVYKTGDLGRFLPDGRIEFKGRLDNQVKIAGNRVELAEVEMSALELKGIEQVLALGKQDDQETKLVLYYKGHQDLGEEHLQHHLREHLPTFMQPSYLIRLNEFPLNINGKIDRKALPPPDLHAWASDYEKPETETEQKLESIIKEILKVGRVGRNVSFFKIGGSSLKAIQTISRIYKEFNVLIKVGHFFSNPTISKLGAIIMESIPTEYPPLKAIEEQEYYDLSHAQRRLWVLEQIHRQKNAYNMVSAFIIEGALDLKAITNTFYTLVERHEILRTTFVNIDGIPKQRIHKVDEFNFKVDVLDYSERHSEEFSLNNLADEEANQLLDLDRGPLIKVKLVICKGNRYLFLITTHHIISDGWSARIIIKEIVNIYSAITQNKESPLPTLPLQYKDYAYWQNNQLQGVELKRLKEFWAGQIPDPIPVLELPNDLPRPKIKTYKGEQIYFELPHESVQKIQGLQQKYEATLFSLLFSYVLVFLYKVTGQRSLLLGTPVTGRSAKELEDQIGFYINTLPIGVVLDSLSTFKEIVKQVDNKITAASDHQHYPFDKIVEDLVAERDLSRTSLFDVMIQIQDSPSYIEEFEIKDFKVEEFRPQLRSSKFDLTFNFNYLHDRILCSLEFNTDIFFRSTVEKFKDDFIKVIEFAGENQFQSLSELRAALIFNSNPEEIRSINEYINSTLNFEFD